MQEMYDMIMKHKRAMADMQRMWEKAIRDHQHEYDSDEDVDQEAGTWEHQLRQMEMEKTRGKPEQSAEKWTTWTLTQAAAEDAAFMKWHALILAVWLFISAFPEWAESLTEMGKGKHFIGDFLPPEELEKFMETFKALKVSTPLSSLVFSLTKMNTSKLRVFQVSTWKYNKARIICKRLPHGGRTQFSPSWGYFK